MTDETQETIDGDPLAVPLCNTTDHTIISVNNSKIPGENLIDTSLTERRNVI